MLTLEERGAYADVIDLYIARDGDLPNDDRRFSYDLACDQRVWRRIKKVLIDAGKIEIIEDMVVPTGGPTTLAKCIARSVNAKEAADSRWRKKNINPLKNNKTGYAGADANADAVAMPINTRQDIKEKESKDSTKKKNSKRNSQVPHDWALDEKMIAFAKSKGMEPATIEYQFDYCKTHHASKGSIFKDWNKVWQTWCIKWVGYGKQQSGTTTTASHFSV